MRNRMNVVWRGNRTTARFPEELFHLYAIAVGDEEKAARELLSEIQGDSVIHPTKAARAYMTGYVASELFHVGLPENRPLPSPEHH